MTRKCLASIVGIALLLCPGRCTPDTVSLDGQWEFCRTTADSLPDGKVEWHTIQVPSFLSQQDAHPFVWYRRSFNVPGEFKGRHVFLRFGAVRFVSQVHLNGQTVGGHYGGWEPFEIDITQACRIGGRNELLVRVQDVTGVIEQEMDYANQGRGIRFISQATDSVMAPVGSRYTYVDIWQPVSLVARNDVYVEDVFVRTSVRNKEIEAEITVRNLADEVRMVHLTSDVLGAGIALGKADVEVPAGSRVKLTLKRGWNKPRLWAPEDPHLYELITRASAGGAELDVRDTRFGFREFWTDGMHLVLNGTRMKFLATAGHPRGELDGELSKDGAKDFYRRIREAGCVGMRLHANIWPEWWYEAADEVGMPLIMESALFCYSSSYALSKPKFWDNYHDHLEAVIKQKRNHPSIVMYSLENEILHCGGDRVEETEHRLAEAGRFVKKLDPTRPIMYDGDADPEGVADVVNLHYPQAFNERNAWPDVGYWLQTGMEVRGWPRKLWRWDKKKPLYFGEFLHIQHYQEADPYSALIGDEAYLDHGLAMAKAKAIAWEMQIEAYRAAEVSGMCPWTLTETGDFPSNDNPRYLAVKRTYQANAAFIREYDTRFYENEEVDRTAYLYNDTLHPAQLTVVWELKKGDATVDQGKKRYDAEPAQKFEFKIRLRMPPAEERTPLTLTLRVSNGKEPAFEESKRYWAFPRHNLAVPAGKRIALFEGNNTVVSALLNAAAAETITVSDLTELPKADILIIGPHALDGIRSPTDALVVGDEPGPRGAIGSFVRGGGSVIVLEQDSYDCGILPAKLLDRGCTIAFRRTRDDHLFEGTTDDDFKFWRDDHVVCRKTIAKPQYGRFRSLIDSGGPAGLVYLPLCEIMDGNGKYILSQLEIGGKLGKEPLAQVMLENVMKYAAVGAAPAGTLAVVQDKLPIKEALNEIDVRFTDISGRLGRSDLTNFSVLIADTDGAEVKRDQARIREYVESGGKVILHGGTRDGFAGIQKLFPESIVAQGSNAIPVSIAAWDAVINGLTNQELYWYGSREGLSYRVRTPLSPDVCRYVISGGLPDPKQCMTVEAESMTVDEGHPKLGEADVYMGSTAAIKKTIDVPETGDYSIAVRGRGTPLGGVYPQIRISLDTKRCGSITTDGEDWGTYAIVTHAAKGEHELKLAFVNDAWAPEEGEDRNAWIDKVIYGATPAMKSNRLLSPAALVKVPLGKGFYLLDQVKWAGAASGSEKAGRYISNILSNLNCEFRARSGGIVITGDKMMPEKGTRLFRTQAGVASLGTNGTIYATVHFAKTGEYEFAIRASGTEAAGEFPNIEVSIDAKRIGSVTLSRPGWQILRLEAEVSEGEHKVGLSFTNDFYDPPADRNLKIGHLEIRAGAG